MNYRLTILFCFMLPPLSAQNQRVEIAARIYSDRFFVVPLAEKGFLLFSVADDRDEYIFVKYNTEMQEEWQVKAVIGKNLDYTKHFYYHNTLYVLFYRVEGHEFEVFKLNTVAGFSEKIEIFSLNNFYVDFLCAYENDLYLAGKSNVTPMLLHFDLKAKKPNILPINFKGSAEIKSLELDTLSKLVHLTLANSWKFKVHKVWLKSYSKGKELKNIELEGGGKKHLIDGKMLALNQRESLIFGNYSIDDNLRGSQGIYIAKLDSSNTIEFIKHHNFTDFANYFAYLKPKEREYTENRVRRLREKENNFTLRFEPFLQEIIRQNGNFMVINNLYYQELSNQPYNNRSYLPIFSGWRYNHSTIAAFDSTGSYLWDNSLETADVKFSELQSLIQVRITADSLLMAYTYGDKIQKQVIRQNEVLHKKEEVEIKNTEEGTKIKLFYKTQLSHWFNNYFLIYGFQQIGGANRRKVFFVEKVEL